MLSGHTVEVNTKIKELYDWCASNPDGATPRVVVACPGPPGVGKTTAVINELIERRSGNLYEPGHNQAKEKQRQLRDELRRRRLTFTDVKDRHVQGLARRCAFLTKDEWVKIGWSFGDVACDHCPVKKQCPSQTQHWMERDITLGVHPMSNWGGQSGLLVIDELPEPVSTRVYSWEEIARVGRKGWHRKLEGWRVGMHQPWNDWITMLQMFSYSVRDVKPWGTTYSLTDLFKKGTAERRCLDECIDYLSDVPMPKPDSDAVRSEQIKYTDWIPADLETLLRVIRWESDGVDMKSRMDLGMPYTACIRAFGDKNGDTVRFDIEMRKMWSPPSKNHMILDSSSYFSHPVYSALYSRFGYDFQIYENKVALDQPSIDLIHYPTYGFSRSRSIIGNNIKKEGTQARIRAIQEILNKISQLRRPGNVINVGIIDHKSVLEACGWDFNNHNVLSGVMAERVSSATDDDLEYYLSELEKCCHITVGYHGGTIGSNEFTDCRILSVIGDPIGHIGMQAEEARTLGLDPDWYIQWKLQTAAYQEVYRARLLDASPTNKKTVMYFGSKAPLIEGAHWRTLPWAEGGRIPSRANSLMQRMIWSHVGEKNNAFFGALMPEFKGLHATLTDGPLLALRVLGETPEYSSPKNRESYRRAAAYVGEEMGYTAYEMPHPFGARRPITVFASSQAHAQQLCADVIDLINGISIVEKKRIESKAPAASNQRRDDDTLLEKVEDIRKEITSIKKDMSNFKRMAQVRAATGSPIPPAFVKNILDNYRTMIKDQLAEWRKVRHYYVSTNKVGKYLPYGLTNATIQ
jgi:hypothetical protein